MRLQFWGVAAAGLLILWLGRTGLAADYLVPAGTPETSPITLDLEGDSLTVENGGTLSIAAGDAAVTATADEFVITNDGTIEYFDFVTGAIWVSSSQGGLVRNEASGVISAPSIGIYAQNSSFSLFNSGFISAEVGVFLQSTEVGVVNSGDILATVNAIEMHFSHLMLVNNGTIEGSNGIDANLGTFDLTNSGEVKGTGYGIRLFESTGTLDNTGSISGGSDGDNGDEEGIHQHGSALIGSNSGTILGDDIGFSVHDSSTLDFENTGTIQGDTLYGLWVFDETIAETTVVRLANSGSILGGDAGILVKDAELDLINTGKIEGGMFGIFQTGTGGLKLANAGLVAGSSHALFLDGSGNSVTLLPGSVLDGAIYFASPDNSLIFGNGLSALLTLDSTSALPASLDTNGMPFVIDSTSNQIAVVDPTGFAMADEMLTDLADSVLDAVSRRSAPGAEGEFSASLPSGETVAAAARRFASGTSLWGEVFGRWRDQEEGGAVWSSDHRLSGVLAGLDGEVSEGWSGGVFLGAAAGDLSVDDGAQDIESQSLYGGVHLARDWHAGLLKAALLLGWQENDSIRRLASNAAASGVETAKASYDGVFVVPEIGYERRTGAFVSSLSARYAGLFLDDYEEHGSSADLEVDSRSIHLAGADFRLSRPSNVHLPEGTLVLEPRVGLKGSLLLGGDEISLQVLSTSVDEFHIDQEEAVLSLYAGAGATFRSDDGRLALRFTGDAGVATDGSVILSVGLGGDFAF